MPMTCRLRRFTLLALTISLVTILPVARGALPASNLTFQIGSKAGTGSPRAGSVSIPTITTAAAQGEVASTIAHPNKASARVTIGPNSPATGELVVTLQGLDRMVAGQGESFLARRIRPNGKPFEIRANSLLCQSSDTQDGISLAIETRPCNKPIRIEPTGALDGGVTIRIPWSKSSTSQPALVVALRGMTGDAMLALDAIPMQPHPAPTSGKTGPAVAAKASPTKAYFVGEAPPATAANAPADMEATLDTWRWFTGDSRAMAPLLADQREAQVRLGYMVDDDGDSLMDVVIGTDLVLLENRFDKDKRFTLSARALITGRLDFTLAGNPILNTDYYGGIAAGYRTGDTEWEAYLYHESSHLGDEVITETGRARIDYSREALRLMWGHYFHPNTSDPDETIRVYGGVTFNLTGDPEDIRHKFILQAGAEYRFRGWDLPMYLALDVQAKGEHDFYPNINAQYGIELGPDSLENKPRVFLEFYHGYSEMSQYWDTKETHALIGFGYNFR